jgi:hypothetical protein
MSYRRACRKRKALVRNNAELADILIEAAWTSDIGPIRLAIAAHGKSIFRSLAGRYRRAIAGLQSLCREKLPGRLQDRLFLLDKLIAAQLARRILEGEGEFGQAVLGSVWASERTQWAVVEALLTWANEAEREDSALNLLALAPSVDSQGCSTLASELESALAAFRTAFTKVAEFIRPSTIDILALVDFEQAPLESVSAKLDIWSAILHDFDSWVSAREALETLRSWKMEMLAEGLKDGTIQSSEAKPMADLLIAEALWHCARSDDPALDEIDGTLRSEIVSQFRVSTEGVLNLPGRKCSHAISNKDRAVNLARCLSYEQRSARSGAICRSAS